MADSSDVTMTALKDHPGYNYNGTAQLLFVKAGDTFTTSPARAERLVAKGVAEKGSAEAVAASREPEAKAPKVDGRTKAGRADKAHRR